MKSERDYESRYLILDARAVYDLDRAIVLDIADTLDEARDAAKAQGDGNCIFESSGGAVSERDLVEVVD